MSSWTDAEVAELERKGNDYCRQTWLKKAPQEGVGGRPKPGMDINVYKRFVVDAYEHKRYYGEHDGTVRGPVPAAPAPAPATFANPQASRARRVKKPVAAAPASAPLPQVADLLDFAAPPAPAALKLGASNHDMFAADFTMAPAAAAPKNNDMFVANFSSPSPAPVASGNGFPMLAKPGDSAKPAPAPSTGGFSLSSVPASTSSATSTLSDFAGLSIQGSSGTIGTKKPIMGSGGASAISMMGAQTIQPMQHNQQPMQMGWQQMGMSPQMQQMGMTPQMQQQQQLMMMQQQQRMQMNGGGMNSNMMMGSGMSMNSGMGMGMNSGMSMNSGMNNMSMGGGFSQQSQQQQNLSMNSMPGGDVMATMGMLNQKKK